MVDLSCAMDTIIYFGCNNRRITSNTVVLQILAFYIQNDCVNNVMNIYYITFTECENNKI